MKRSFIARPVFHSVRLKCPASGAPPLQYKWLKNDKEIGFQRLRPSLNTRTWYLSLWRLILSDTGKYTCIVSNAYGSIRHTYIVHVTGKCCTGTVLHQWHCLSVYAFPHTLLSTSPQPIRHSKMKSVSIISPITVFPRQGFGAVDIIFRFNLQEVLRGVHAFFIPEMYLRMQIYSWKKKHRLRQCYVPYPIPDAVPK